MVSIREKIIVFLFPLILALPFINRAYFVDDHYFVEIASWLQDHPDKPYHFRTDDAGIQNPGWEEDGLVRMVNPLVHHYYLAGLLKIGGKNEWFLRLGCVLLVCFSALFLLQLARRWTNDPLLSTLLILATPVHWLTSYSLLIDSTLSFFFLGGLYFFIRGAERDHLGFFFLSGVFMGLAILTKYPGVLILPLTATWAVLYRKKIVKPMLVVIPWLIALGFLAAYSGYTAKLYGEPHILAASKRMVSIFGPAKLFVLLIFFSGVTLVPVLMWKRLPRKGFLLALILVLGVTAFMASPFGGFSLTQGFLFGLWIITSVGFLYQFWDLRNELIKPRDPFLILWILGFMAMMVLTVGWVAARYFMLVVPAIVFFTVRMIEIGWRNQSDSIIRGLLAFLLCFSSFLAYADYRQAEPSRQIGQMLNDKGFEGSANSYYMGDSFTMSYLREEGWIPWFPGTINKKGDLILTKMVTMPPIYNWREKIEVEPRAVFDFPSRFPIKVMDFRGSAGFYASLWGGLPFTISWGPWERFVVYEVTGPRNQE